MKKEFNDTGLCVPERHYMADTSKKIGKILELVERGKCFTINRPRQFGKTTILSLLAKRLNQRNDFIALKISFEGIDRDSYQHQKRFIRILLEMFAEEFEYLNLPQLSDFTGKHVDTVKNMPDLSRFITKLIDQIPSKKALVLMIDEVDKSSNNRLFMDFLGMLRNKYLQRDEGLNHTFQSVILAGVHDIKTLKTVIRPDDERRYNSPWNIAVDFKIDMRFSPPEIEIMLQDYSQENGIHPDIPVISEKLHYYTAGYPYLVSKLCKFIDEEILPDRAEKNWFPQDAETAFQLIADGGYTTTLFDSMTKNLENNPELYDLVFRIVINGEKFRFIIADPVMNIGHLYGILTKSEQGLCRIHNRIFEQRIYDYMMSKYLRKNPRAMNGLSERECYMDEGNA